MGLSDRDKNIFDKEDDELIRMGIPITTKSLSDQASGYLNKVKPNNKTKTKKNTGLGVTIGGDDSKKPRLLKVSTFGFKDGALKHNMPCPVCLNEPAVYISNEHGNYFAPCRSCEELGFVLEKRKKTSGGFWS